MFGAPLSIVHLDHYLWVFDCLIGLISIFFAYFKNRRFYANLALFRHKRSPYTDLFINHSPHYIALPTQVRKMPSVNKKREEDKGIQGLLIKHRALLRQVEEEEAKIDRLRKEEAALLEELKGQWNASKPLN